MISLLEKKARSENFQESEIAEFIQKLCKKEIPDYQASAWLMACFINGLNPEETFYLTQSIKNSGLTRDWKNLSSKLKSRTFSDKHSTGGIGDKVSLILAPLAAATGLTVPMMSGRGLGHTGGTIDKLESIPGFNVYPDLDLQIKCLEENNICMMAQSADLCPADKILYSLRDVTGTVANKSLITASIVSKKWAEGISSIVFDVKCGQAAFMTDYKKAKELAESLCAVSTKAGLTAKASITQMDAALGSKIGHSLEVLECVQILKNEFQSEQEKNISSLLTDLCIHLTAQMLIASGLQTTMASARQSCISALDSGRAYECFQKMLSLQGADSDWEKMFNKKVNKKTITSTQSGYLKKMNSRIFGELSPTLKMGRNTLEDKLTLENGIDIHVIEGQRIKYGDELFTVHYNDNTELPNSFFKTLLEKGFTFSSQEQKPKNTLIIEEIS